MKKNTISKLNKHSKLKKLKTKCYAKNMTGGSNCNFTDWEIMVTNGQNNNGIYKNKKDKTIIMKCGANISKDVTEINSKASIFPKEISECENPDETKSNKSCLIMERFDGDITSLFFNRLPMFVLEEMKKEKEKDKDNQPIFKPTTISSIKKIFDIKTYTTMKPIIPIETHVNILSTISTVNKEITLDLYNKFIERLKLEWIQYHSIISKEIIRILLKLLEFGYFYGDMKFDNFGYKLSEIVIETDFRKGYVPKIFGQYFYVYILDPASGLENLIDYYKIDNYFTNNRINGATIITIDELVKNLKQNVNLDNLEKIYKNSFIEQETNSKHSIYLSFFNDSFNLSANGQYSLSFMNKKIIDDDYYTHPKNNKLSQNIKLSAYCSPEINDILKTEYECIFPRNKIKDIEELKELVDKNMCIHCKTFVNKNCNFCWNCGIKL